MATITAVKGCAACGGDIYAEKDSYGEYQACLQCGRSSETKHGKPPEPVREWVVHQEPTVTKAHRDVQNHQATKFCPVHETEVVWAKGVCKTCWQSLYRNRKECTEDGCVNRAQRGGLCQRHYNQNMRQVAH